MLQIIKLKRWPGSVGSIPSLNKTLDYDKDMTLQLMSLK